MNRQLFIFPGNEGLGEKLLKPSVLQRGDMILRRFPDGESYVRILSDVKEQNIILLCTLHRPDEKIMPIYFFSNLARRLGARSVTLIAPYLAYMRQDKAFHPGEAVTSDAFARLLSGWIDELITIDPHLHRHHRMSEIYSVPTRVLHAEPLIAGYIRNHVARPVIIGPDAESEQWVSDIARRAQCQYQILKKERLGDRQVRISLPNPGLLQGHTPVLADDIISTGRTMIETVRHLQEMGASPPVCIGVHGIFANNAWEELKKSGVRDIVTTNTISHPTNRMDVSGLILEGN